MGTPVRRLGRYELVARIGEGGMAEVYLARQRGPRQFEKLVVVKLVHPQAATRPELAAMLLDEARIAALLKHPNCVDVYDLGEEDGTFFIAMEYLEGESLASILRASRDGPRLDPFSTAKIICECATGLHYAHELRGLDGEPLELVHQDVTPGNIFVLYTGQVKLVDFGVATIRTTADSEMVRGKAGYLAPELLEGARADRRTDVFALGVVLWESLTLRRLFWAADEATIFSRIKNLEIPRPSSLDSSVIGELDEVCLKALARDPAQRYQTAQAMRDDLEQVLRHASWAGGDGPVARYMQAAFAGRIKARQLLLRELVAARSPRAATLERIQAIHDDEPGTPKTPANLTPDAIEVIEVSEPIEIEPPRRRRRWIELGVGVALLGGVAAVAGGVIGRGSSSSASPTAVVTERAGDGSASGADHAPPPTTTVPVPVPVIAAAPPAAGSGSGSSAPATPPIAPTAALPQAAADRSHHHHDHDRVAVAPIDPAATSPAGPVAVSAKSLYKEGLQDFVAGRTSTAIERFHKALALDPSYAPAYRGMGMAYERGGDRARAAQAYRKYLALAGDAADAAQIRSRLAGVQ